MERKCCTCKHFRHTQEVVDGYEDMGFILIPKVKKIPTHCALGYAIYQPICVYWQQEPTPFDGMITKADEILNELSLQKL